MLSFKSFIKEQGSSSNPVKIDAYHGSGRHFQHFDQKMARLPNDHYGGGVAYFTDDHDVAKTYAKSMSKETKTPHVYHTSLDMNNVFDIDHSFHGKHLQKLLPKDTEKFASSAGILHAGNADEKYHILGKLERGEMPLTGHQVFWGLSHGGTKTSAARSHLIKHGYDGLRYNGGMMVPGAKKHNVYIPYNSDSIKINHIEKI
mgnify:CR=1 FL=1